MFLEPCLEGCGMPGLGSSVGSSAVPARPPILVDDLPVHVTEWVAPGAHLCNLALAGSRRTVAQECNIRQQLLQHWTQRHRGFRQADFESLPKVSHSTSPCLLAGFCVCGPLEKFVAAVWALHCMFGHAQPVPRFTRLHKFEIVAEHVDASSATYA
jgi:hypothetical protein